MISDFAVPKGCEPASRTAVGGIERTQWTVSELGALTARLAESAETLRAIPTADLERAWQGAIEPLLNATSGPRQALAAAMAGGCELSPPALEAALDAMLGGFAGEPARQLIERGDSAPPTGDGSALAVIAGNIPALAVQVLLPALAARRPLLIKSPSSEPFFAAMLVERLTTLLPAVGDSIAALSWPGGNEDLERGVLEQATRLVAYGHGGTLADLRRRFNGPMVELGPKLSVAIVSADVDPANCAAELAHDIALFDQRGCLSIQTIFTDAPPQPLADALTRALDRQAELWPPATLRPELAAEIQQLRHRAALEGASVSSLPIRRGTVLAFSAETPDPELQALPGGRTVRIQSLADLTTLPSRLTAWRGSIQGAALAGTGADALAPGLRSLGVTRIAPPGTLQSPDALWANGDRHLFEKLR